MRRLLRIPEGIQVTADDAYAIRTRLGLSRVEMAELLSCSPQSVRNWEQGNPRLTGPALIVYSLIRDRIAELAMIERLTGSGESRTEETGSPLGEIPLTEIFGELQRRLNRAPAPEQISTPTNDPPRKRGRGRPKKGA